MKLSTVVVCLLLTSNLLCQIIPGKPSVFLDCQMNCFSDYLRQEVLYIDYARNRQDADVYVLATQQSASAGSREVQLIFNYNSLSAYNADTIKYIRPPNISDAERRTLFETNLKRGLLPALFNSAVAERITFDITPDESDKRLEEAAEDPWNLWSFNVSVNLNINGESTFKEEGFFSRISASRVTEKDKIVFASWYNLNNSKFTLSDGEEVTSENERFRMFFQYVKSIDDHWSYGIRTFGGSSTFGNTDFEAAFRPALEFNVFPYSENSTKRFTFLYSAGVDFRDYTEVTIFDKTKETLLRHGLDIEFSQTQPWGDIEFDIEFDQFFHDLSLYSISFNPNIELNIVKGLSLEFGGDISFVGDRINITKTSISDQDIILQNRQLDTNYSYFSYFGFNYQFGSKNNNVVNPRF